MMDFRMNEQTPHFSYEEVVAIYQQTKHPDSNRMRETAKAMYPGRDPITYENLFVEKGHGVLLCTMASTKIHNAFCFHTPCKSGS